MSFQTALSGLNAAQTNLGVTGNNIANASTNGFKHSRAEFADIYTSSFATTSQVGSGVRVANIGQMFSQGNVEFTDNSLDLAINGEGFFVIEDSDGSMLYTRAGAYFPDREGNIVNSNGQHLMGYPAVDGDLSNDNTLSQLQLSSAASDANSTTTTEVNLNLDASVEVLNQTPISFDPNDEGSYNLSHTFVADGEEVVYYFVKTGDDSWMAYVSVDGVLEQDPEPIDLNAPTIPAGWLSLVADDDGMDDDFETAVGGIENDDHEVLDDGGVVFSFPSPDPNSYNFSTSTTIYDSLGGAHTQTVYFIKSGVNTWQTYMALNGEQINEDPVTLTFTEQGRLQLDPGQTSVFLYGEDIDLDNGSGPLSLSVDYTESSQFAGESTINSMQQDGYTSGRISGVEISDTGVLYARYTNGQSFILGEVALARFANVNGLQPMGDTNWAQTFESGERIDGRAGRGMFGQIQSGALEGSNVDISAQLVNMIVAQRDFQANAKMISTEDQVIQSIINIR